MASGMIPPVSERERHRMHVPPRAWLFVAAAFALLTGGCAVNPVSGMPELALVSVEQEKKIGAEEAKKVEKQMGLLDDDPFTSYLKTLGQRLAEESPRKDVTYQFHYVDVAEPNAFALPGGYLYVTRGLLALANSEDELAGVVGHEIGHVAARHSVQTISKRGPFAVVFGIASGITGLFVPVVGNIIGGIGDLTQSIVFSPYSRGQETEADRVGQEMAARAGWDPAALSTFLNTLEREVELKSKGPQKPSFFDSHPATPDRVARTAKHAKDLTRADRPPISASHEAFLARLEGVVVGQRAANGIFEDQAFRHPDFNFFVRLPEKWQLENTPEKIVAAAPDAEAAVLLSAVAEGNDPLDGARAIEEKAKLSGIVARTQKITINGLPAAHTQIEADGRVKLDLTWIAHGGLIYQLVGLAPSKRFDSMQAVFHSAAHSFRPLSASERANIKEKRIRLVKAQAGETIEALGSRSQSAWSKEEISVANNLAVGDQLKAGQLLKVAIAEPYEPKKPR